MDAIKTKREIVLIDWIPHQCGDLTFPKSPTSICTGIFFELFAGLLSLFRHNSLEVMVDTVIHTTCFDTRHVTHFPPTGKIFD